MRRASPQDHSGYPVLVLAKLDNFKLGPTFERRAEERSRQRIDEQRFEPVADASPAIGEIADAELLELRADVDGYCKLELVLVAHAGDDVPQHAVEYLAR